MQRPPANWPTRYWPWSSVEDTDRTFPTAIIAEPFPGAAPPFGSKDEDDDDEVEKAEASFYSWACDTMTSDPTEHEDAVDHSEDGEARDNSFPETRYPHDRVGGGFVAATRLVANDTGPGITSPVSKLPPAPPGVAEKAKEKAKKGRGVEGDGDDGIDPMSTLDKFNWDNFPLPGLGQI